MKWGSPVPARPLRLGALLVGLLLAGDARAETVDIRVLKNSGKLRFEHSFLGAEDGATHVWNQGSWAWTAALSKTEYDGETRICVDVQRLHPSKGRKEVGRPCLTVAGPDTPTAEVRQEGAKATLVVAWQR